MHIIKYFQALFEKEYPNLIAPAAVSTCVQQSCLF